MTRDEGIHLPVGKTAAVARITVEYDADAVAMGTRENCWRRYGRERIASFVKGRLRGRPTVEWSVGDPSLLTRLRFVCCRRCVCAWACKDECD